MGRSYNVILVAQDLNQAHLSLSIFAKTMKELTYVLSLTQKMKIILNHCQ